MQKPPNPFTLTVLLAFAVGGCASADGRYPSLAVRDAERAQGTLEPAAPAVPSVIAITNLESLDAAINRAEATHTKFTSLQGDVAALVSASRGLGPENDTRARALIGVAQLASLRAETALALADLDVMEAKAASGFKRTKDIRDFQAVIMKLLAQQDETLDSLSETLSQ